MFTVKKSTILIFFLGILFCLPIILPYLHIGYFPTHDGEWAVVRASEMFREMRDHQFPPRYSGVLNFGYGYPLFNFAYPFPYYLATILHVFKIGFTDSVKIIFAGSVFVSFFGMYFFSSQFWKNKLSGFLSAVLYLYLPYRLVDLYVRGSIGESIAFALFPLIFLFSFFVFEKKLFHISIICVAILTAVLAMSHNISAVYFGIMFLFFLVSCFFSNRKRESLFLLTSVVWGGLISAFFWIPAILEKQYIALALIPIADRNLYFVNIQQLLFSKWGYGTPTDKDPFTYQLGLSQVASVLLSIPLFFSEKDARRNISLGFFILTLIFICMMFPFSFFIWKLPLLSEINYPWTLLLPLGFLMTFLGGAVAKTKIGIPVLLVLIVLSVILYLPFASPSKIFDKTDSYYLTNEATTTSSNELMPVWVKTQPKTRFVNKILGAGQITNLIYTSSKIQFTIQSDKDQKITVNQIYYPGWKAYVNDIPAEIRYKNKNGLMEVQLSKGTSKVFLVFTETPKRMAADLVSLVSFLALVLYAGYRIFNVLKNKHEKK